MKKLTFSIYLLTFLVFAPGGPAQKAETVSAPSAPDLESICDGGVSSSDNLTWNPHPRFLIQTSQHGALVQMLRDGVVFEEIVGGNIPEFVDDNPPEGSHVYTARQHVGQDFSPESAPLTVTFDYTKPTAAVLPFPGQPSPAVALPVEVQIVFSEPVFTLDLQDDIHFDGSTTPLNMLNIFLTGSGTTYTLDIRSLVRPGTIAIRLRALAAFDRAGNENQDDVNLAIDFQPPLVRFYISGPVRPPAGQALRGPLTVVLTDSLLGTTYTARVNSAGYFKIGGIMNYATTAHGFTLQVLRKGKVLLQNTTTLGSSDIPNYEIDIP